LPFGELLGLFLPLILIGALIYFLMNRPKTDSSPPDRLPSPKPSGGFCPDCGTPIAGGSRFCAGCGHQID